MDWVQSQQAFKQQSAILHRLQSLDFSNNINDYKYILEKCLEVDDIKVYSEQMLAEKIINSLGFDVPKVDGINIIYKYIIQIYRKMEEIEEQNADNQWNNKFIHIAEDMKYDDDFINNEDNLIGDFKPKDLAHASRGIECEFVSKCKHLGRIMDSLSYFGSLDQQNEKNRNELVEYFKEKHSSLLDDHIHVITKHNTEVHRLLQGTNTGCCLRPCISLQRYYQIMINEEQTTKDRISEIDEDFEFYRNIMDSIHCYMYHIADIDVRTQIDDTNIKSLQNSKDNKNKFIISANNDSDGVFEGLQLYMLDIGVAKHVISTIFSKLNSEDYDSDALLEDVEGKEDSTKSHVGIMVQDQYNNIFRYVNSLKVSDSSFSIGYCFYYWKYYKNPLKEDTEYFANKNNHSGFKQHELYIESKYKSLKDEILQNNIYALNIAQYNKALAKATIWINESGMIRGIKAEENSLLHYDVWEGTPLLQRNLLVIIFYTDYTDLCTAFSATFRKHKSYESIKLIKSRNREYANWSRILRETVELFGQRGWEKRENKDEERRWNRQNNRIKGPFFCGIKGLMVVPEFNIRLCAPTSASAQIEIAYQFAKGDGIVITLNNNGHWHSDNLKIWDCSWLSQHPEEDERLIIGGAYTIRIQGVRKILTKQNFEDYYRPLFYYDCMMTGVPVNKHEPKIKKEHEEMLRHLMYCSLNLIKCNHVIDEYIHDTFRAYINHRKEVIINLHQIHKYFDKLKHLIIHTSSRTWECALCDAKGNSINSTRCRFCNTSAQSDIYGLNNILKPTVFQLYHNVNHIVIYTTIASGQNDYEYAFDLNNFLNAVDDVANFFTRKAIKIEIKATHQYKYNDNKKEMKRIHHSWLYNEWQRNGTIIQSEAKSMGFTLKLNNTKNHGARDYLEDTLTLTM